MARPTVAGRRQRGVIYLALMILIATLGAGLAATATFWHQVQQRAREQELLFIGQQYRRAIQHYYESGGGGRYPPTLDALLLDERTPSIRRYLRRPFRDPLTGTPEWGLVQAPQGGIMGVYSLAAGRPIKKANFPAVLNWENDLAAYADWKFVYLPAQATQNLPPALSRFSANWQIPLFAAEQSSPAPLLEDVYALITIAKESPMNKARDSRKEAKKSPIKTQKEKRSDKHLKKGKLLHQDFLVKPLHNPVH